MSGSVLTVAEVARLLGRRPEWLSPARRTELEAVGFPAPLAGVSRPTYARQAVMAWLAGGAPAPAPVPVPAADVDGGEDWARILDRRAAQLAGR